MKRGGMSLSFAAVLALGACGADQSRGDGRSNARPADSGLMPAVVSAGLARDTPPVPRAALEPRERARSGRPVALRQLHTEEGTDAGARYERVVFEFGGDSAPGYRVTYADGPVRRCGSGDPVSVQGAERLVVRFAPAQAHGADGAATPAPRELAPGLPLVKELKLICDFEGQVEWVLGLAGRHPFRVVELAGPPRVAIDVVLPH